MDELNKKVVDVSTLAYDLTAIMDFVLQNKSKDKTSEIKEFYTLNDKGSLTLINKELTESKNEESNGVASIRYDLVRHLMDKVDSIIMNDFDTETDDSNDMMSEITSPLMTSLGDTFAINTLLREGMLVNMDFNELDKENE